MPVPAASEKEWQRQVMEYAGWQGWKRQHSRNTTITRNDGTVRHATAISGDPGFVDLTLARHGQVVFLELKTEKGGLTEWQVGWLAALSGESLPNARLWNGRDPIPDGRALLPTGWVDLMSAGDYWHVLVAGPVRPRHQKWVFEALK